MKTLCFLLLACVAHMVAAKGTSKTCVGKKMGVLTQFRQSVDLNVPCKYPAIVKQACGDYEITVTPGNIWLGDNYYVNTMWLNVKDTVSGKMYDGRTTNRLIVKHVKSKGERAMFNKGNEEPFDMNIFKTEIDKNKKGERMPRATIRDKKDTFQVTFEAWDPYDKKQFPHSSWEFTCKAKDFAPKEYPEQMCGGYNWKVEDEAKEKGIQANHLQVEVYRNIFTSNVVQTDPECIDAADILSECGDESKQIEVLKSCGEILSKKLHTECVTYYQCTPMEAFNSCLRWGCAERKAFDPQDKELCYEVGEAMFLCGEVSGAGNLTARVKDANCYKDFIDVDFFKEGQAAKESS